MIRESIARIATGATLSTDEAAAAMEEIMTGSATPAQMGAFLTALRLRPGGETVEELAGLANVMRDKALQVYLEEPFASRAMDTCGTGGDGAGTLNISTAAGIIAAAAGAVIAKHGNRSATSKCGSADVLEVLGVKIDLSPQALAYSIEQCGFGFMFAQTYHPAMKHVGPTRREIGIRTVFNILGPLTNPAHTPYQVLGVPDKTLMRKMGEVLLHLGGKHALIVHSADGLDECSLAAPTYICEVRAGEEMREYTITPEEVGLTRVSNLDGIKGGNPEQNAATLRELLSSFIDTPATHTICLNAAAALVANEQAGSFREGIQLAQDTLRTGKAKNKLAEIIECSQSRPATSIA